MQALKIDITDRLVMAGYMANARDRLCHAGAKLVEILSTHGRCGSVVCGLSEARFKSIGLNGTLSWPFVQAMKILDMSKKLSMCAESVIDAFSLRQYRQILIHACASCP